MNKYILAGYFLAIYSHAPKITHLAFGAYLKKIGAFFLGGKADYNLSRLFHFHIYHFMIPPANISFDHFPWESFSRYLAKKMFEFDSVSAQERDKQYTPYSVLGLLLLPEFYQRIGITGSLSQAADEVVTAFCDTYKGIFLEEEKNCFRNA
ncbi:MAG TPA: hypothetical protein PLD88_12695, partial [Candidatus Berkiella sp.]|nr:hypothetical protein [Candidatus Berkiella sp.]